ncbi:hypothetical protein AURDEDRAFT_170829 [Auricularia subglabra TFB-10046 SS5]|nr:hypothetical protein AURDEDRAFT_170829 [Auricularia subglabra TFB-10046 SS5]
MLRDVLCPSGPASLLYKRKQPSDATQIAGWRHSALLFLTRPPVPMLSPVTTPGRFDTPTRHLSASPSKRKREASESPPKAVSKDICDFKRRKCDQKPVLSVTESRSVPELPDAKCHASSRARDKVFSEGFMIPVVSGIFDLLPFPDIVSASGVSKAWRELLLKMPKYWQDLTLSLPGNVVDARDQNFLLRSQETLRLRITVRAKTSLVEWLSPHLARVETLDIAAVLRLPSAEKLSLFMTKATPLEKLVSFALSVPKAHDCPFVVPAGLFPSGATNLQHVRLQNVHLPSDDDSIAAFENVRSLHYTLAESVATLYISRIFQLFPSLRRLSLLIHGLSGPARVTYHAPLLVSVSLSRPIMRLISVFLDRTAFPALEELSLAECSGDMLNAFDDPVHDLFLRAPENSPAAATLIFSAGLRLEVIQFKYAAPLLLGARLLSNLRRLSLPGALVHHVKFGAPEHALAHARQPLELCVDGASNVGAVAAELERCLAGRSVVLAHGPSTTTATTDNACL